MPRLGYDRRRVRAILARPDTWLLVTLVLLGLALAAGYRMYEAGRPIARPPKSPGYVTIFLSDPNVRAEASSSVDLGEAPPDIQLRVEFSLTGDEPAMVEWAVVLSGAYALPASGPDYGEIGLSLLADDPSLQIFNDPSATATYVTDVSAEAGHPASAIIGSITLSPADPATETSQFFGWVEVRIPPPTTLVKDSGDGLALDLPVLGLPRPPESLGGEPFETEFGFPREILPAPDRDHLMDPRPLLPAEVLSKLNTEEPSWWYPRNLEWSFQLYRDRPEERLEGAIPPPIGPTNWYWEGVNRLEIDALVSRPSARATRESNQFWAGLILGAAAALFLEVLALGREIARRPDRD